MKTLISSVLVLFFTTISIAQEPPILKVGDTQVGLSSLDISVEVVGNTATTTFDMLYYNPTAEILEGELSFPLGEHSNVSRFALDINGKLREAVVVNKELGRIAFEDVVRRQVDPALLEKGTGNNYKARIYPIPAKGYKRIVLAYEQELLFKEDGYYYDLPLHFQNKLDRFKLALTVFEQEDKPIIEKGQVSGLEFKNWQRNYRSIVEKSNYIPNKSLLIKIPTKVDTKKVFVSNDHFYAHLIVNPQKKIREKAKEITVFWDASLSMKDRDLAKEIALLDAYFSYTQNVIVHFKSFSNTFLKEEKYSVRNGNWNHLRKELEATIYDGGTNYALLNSAMKSSDLILLFSDGIQSLSDFTYYSRIPVIIANSLKKSNHSALKLVAERSNGAYINLTNKSAKEAFATLKYQQYQFLGYTSNAQEIDLYPKANVNIEHTFSIAGKNLNSSDAITLYFGYNNQITERIELQLKTAQKDVDHVSRMWAQKRLDFLQQNSKKHKEAIIALATTYSLVTDYTSLIVLEEVMDYVRYKIEPPAELLEEYNTILARLEADKNTTLEKLRILNDEVRIIDDVEEVEESVITHQYRNGNTADFNVGTTSGFMNWQSSGNGHVMNRELPDNFQEVEEVSEEEEIADQVFFAIVEESPIFPGCESLSDINERKRCFSQKLQQHFAHHFNTAVANELNLSEGLNRVFVQFTISEEGTIENVQIRAPHNRIEQEITRVMNTLPQMIPGKQRNRAVSVRYTLPITFRVGADGTIITNASTTPTQIPNNTTNIPIHPTYNGTLKVADATIQTSYIKELQQFKTAYEAYDFYLQQRAKHLETPAYYVDVFNFFKNTFDATAYANRILSNIAETDFDNYELLKVYGYQLQATDQHQLALFVFKRVLELRTEDVQSYRDMALAHENVGECQEAFDLLESVLSGSIYKGTHRRQFEGLNSIVRNEINHLLNTYKGDIDTDKYAKDEIQSETFDVRIVVDWNHNDTDIDLHIIDPNLEECYYQHKKTHIGGQMSDDMTQGFGPEEFTLKDAVKGDYFVKIKYFGDRYQKVENPTFMKVTMYSHYGTLKETKETKIIRLTRSKDETIVAKLHF